MKTTFVKMQKYLKKVGRMHSGDEVITEWIPKKDHLLTIDGQPIELIVEFCAIDEDENVEHYWNTIANGDYVTECIDPKEKCSFELYKKVIVK